MLKYTITTPPVAGFVAEEIKAGEQGLIITKCPLATSDMPQFHVWMRHITSLFLAKSPVPVPVIHRFLILLHADNNADVFINDFKELMQVRVVESVAAGSPVFVNNISDINEVVFPDIEIKKDDAVIYGARIEWRFSLYFDFGRAIDPKVLSEELGTLRREATFYLERAELDAKLSPRRIIENEAVVITEGKSDLKHLMAAAEVLEFGHHIELLDDDKGRGADTLYTMCEHYSLVPQPKPMIFVFDRDREDILKRLATREGGSDGYQEWGNNVYSLSLPVPSSRSEDTHSLSIEFLYTDTDLCRPTKQGRRVFLSSEFNPHSGRHLSEDIHTTRLNRLKGTKITIIDDGVFDRNSHNIALSKDDFADAVLNDEAFKSVDRSAFRLVFDVVDRIIKNSSSRNVLADRNWRPARGGNTMDEQLPVDTRESEIAELQSLEQGNLSPDDLDECISVLEEGRAVDIASARDELPLALVVVVKRINSTIVGVGAIKRQRPPYAARVAASSRHDFDPNMHELGYVAVKRAYGNRGISKELVSALLNASSSRPLWATTLNPFMERTLTGAGFKRCGESWSSQSGEALRLWIRSLPHG